MNKTEKLDMYGCIKHLSKEFALSTFPEILVKIVM